MRRLPVSVAGLSAVLAVAAAVLLAGLLVWLLSRDGAAPPESVPRSPAAGSSPERTAAPTQSLPAVDVLRAWDERRADAYADGDVAALRSLYVEGSTAGRADARVLRGYLRRGLVVRGMRMQLLDVQVLRRGADRLRVRVTDRLVGAVAVGDGVRRRLPHDRASAQEIVLRRTVTGLWQVASVNR